MLALLGCCEGEGDEGLSIDVFVPEEME